MIHTTIEYRVRPVTRYIITRYEQFPDDGPQPGPRQLGEYDNDTVAYEVAYALCKAEHERLGLPIGDERIQYPERPEERTGLCQSKASPPKLPLGRVSGAL